MNQPAWTKLGPSARDGVSVACLENCARHHTVRGANLLHCVEWEEGRMGRGRSTPSVRSELCVWQLCGGAELLLVGTL